MKRQQTILATFLLLCFLAAGCGQRNDTGERTDAEVATENLNAVPENAQVEPSASTARDIPGSDAASRVTSRSLIDNAATNKDLTTFTSLLQSANLVRSLSGTGPYTVFAPQEAAFKALPGNTLGDLMKPENRELLEQLINNHIIAGKLTTEDLQDGAMLKTASGNQLKVTKKDDEVSINGAKVEDPNGMSSNGVLHVINKVLVPIEEE